MKIQIITIILILSMITIVSAISAGENETIIFDGNVSNCYLIGHNDLEGINLIENGTKVIIQTVPNFKPDNLTLICDVKYTIEYNTGRRTVYKNNTLYENNTVYETEYIYLEDNITGTLINDSIIDVDDQGEKKKMPIWMVIVIIILVIIIIVIINIGYNNMKKEKEPNKDFEDSPNSG